MYTNARAEGKHSGTSGLSHMPLFSTVPPSILEKLKETGQTRHFKAGQTVMHADDPQDIIGVVQSGFLRMQKTLTDGRQQIVSLLIEGDLCGRVFGNLPNFTLEAATDAKVCTFAREPFQALLLQSQELERLVFLSILNEMDRARDWIMILSNQKVSSRLAGFLLILTFRFTNTNPQMQPANDKLDVRIPLSRPDLSHLLGTRPETISRAFHALAKDGCIEICKPDLIRILDLQALAIAAGDEDLAEPHYRNHA